MRSLGRVPRVSRRLTPRQFPRNFSVASRCGFGPAPHSLSPEKSSFFGSPLDPTPDRVRPFHEESAAEDIQCHPPSGLPKQEYLNHDSPKIRSGEGLPRLERTGAGPDATVSSVQQQMKELSENIDANSAKQAARLERGFNHLSKKLSKFQRKMMEKVSTPITPAAHRDSTEFVGISGSYYSKLLVRDACNCIKCVDPSSTQKNFQTTDIPSDIDIKSMTETGDNIEITWLNDIPGFETDHTSVYPKKVFNQLSGGINYLVRDRLTTAQLNPMLWDAKEMEHEFEFVNFEDYMTKDETLHRALLRLNSHGLLLIRGIPESSADTTVEDIAGRIGNIRDTFYGRSWDVRSVPDAKNVAYTSRYLGLHMDLLYMENPPGYQFLHCLKNTAEGGASIFSDAMKAAWSLSSKNREILTNLHVAYQYKNAGKHYYHTHPVLEKSRAYGKYQHVNYSPPFQAPWSIPTNGFDSKEPFDQETDDVLNAFRKFSRAVEDPANVLEYRLQPGECVIFNNRRVLHGRKAFDAIGGERHYKGTYVDTDVISSTLRAVHSRQRPDSSIGTPGLTRAKALNKLPRDYGNPGWVFPQAQTANADRDIEIEYAEEDADVEQELFENN